jgi:hypothetical protein
VGVANSLQPLPGSFQQPYGISAFHCASILRGDRCRLRHQHHRDRCQTPLVLLQVRLEVQELGALASARGSELPLRDSRPPSRHEVPKITVNLLQTKEFLLRRRHRVPGDYLRPRATVRLF